MTGDADYLAGKQAYIDGRLDAAEGLLRAYLDSHPDHFESKVYLGRSVDGQGRVDEAIGFYRAALAENPDHAAAHLMLAQSLLAIGEYAEGWRE